LEKETHRLAIAGYTNPHNIKNTGFVPTRLSRDEDYINRDNDILTQMQESGGQGFDQATGEKIASEILGRYSDEALEHHHDMGRRFCRFYSKGPFLLKIALIPEALPELRKNISSVKTLSEKDALGYTPIIDWGPDDDDISYILMLRGQPFENLLMKVSSQEVENARILTDRIGEFMFSKGRVQYGEQVADQARTYMDFMFHRLIGRSTELDLPSQSEKLKSLRNPIKRRICRNEPVCWGLDDAIIGNYIYIPNGKIKYHNVKIIDQGHLPIKLETWKEEFNLDNGFDRLLKIPHFELGRLNASISNLLSGHLSIASRNEIQKVLDKFVFKGIWDFHDEELVNTKSNYWSRNHPHEEDKLLSVLFKLGEISVYQNVELSDSRTARERSERRLDEILEITGVKGK